MWSGFNEMLFSKSHTSLCRRQREVRGALLWEPCLSFPTPVAMRHSAHWQDPTASSDPQIHPPSHNALHLRRRDDEAAGGRAPRPAHVEALPLVGAIADAGLQVAQGACGAGAGNGHRVRGRRPPQRSQPPPNGRSPCSAHATASIAARHRRPAPAARSSQSRGAPSEGPPREGRGGCSPPASRGAVALWGRAGRGGRG